MSANPQRQVRSAPTPERGAAWGLSSASPIGIALIAPDGRLLGCNRALCDITGYCSAELLQLTAQRLTHAEDRLQFLAAYQEMRNCGRGQAMGRGLRKDGTAYERQVVLLQPRGGAASDLAHYLFVRPVPAQASMAVPAPEIAQPQSDPEPDAMQPVCAWCKRLRTRGNSWHRFESCLLDLRRALFTHGMCPSCYRREIAGKAGDDA